MKLVIAGGRNYKFTIEDMDRLDELNGKYKVSEVVCGGASGADTEGAIWAIRREIKVTTFRAEWDKYGRSAGPRRNEKMADYADAVLLFPGGAGTESMFNKAVAAHKIIFDWRNGYENETT